MADPLSPNSNSAARTASEPRRLGKNLNGYFGDTIDIRRVLSRCEEAARRRGWKVETITAAPGLDLLAFHHRAVSGIDAHRVYISAGIHGDEPAGPLAVERLLEEGFCPDPLEMWICPCLNPTGFHQNRRENEGGTDLNRQYLQPNAKEIIAHTSWLQNQPRFDLCLCLHEDWESHGFYLYELNPDNLPSLAEAMVRHVREICPIDESEMIEGRPAKGGIIRPSVDPLSRPQWPEAFFLLTHKTRLSYTLEAPSDFPIQPRISALTVAVTAAVHALAKTDIRLLRSSIASPAATPS